MHKFNVLIVEDVPIILDFYKSCLESSLGDIVPNFEIYTADSLESSKEQIDLLSKSNHQIDIAIIDLRLRNLKTKEVSSGLEVSLLLRKLYTQSKIIIITSLASEHVFSEVFDLCTPEGFIIKDEIENSTYFSDAIESVISESYFFSETVKEFLRRKALGLLKLDQIDRNILLLLEQGYGIKDIANKLATSVSSIEKRKINIGIALNLQSNHKHILIKTARELMVI